MKRTAMPLLIWVGGFAVAGYYGGDFLTVAQGRHRAAHEEAGFLLGVCLGLAIWAGRAFHVNPWPWLNMAAFSYAGFWFATTSPPVQTETTVICVTAGAVLGLVSWAIIHWGGEAGRAINRGPREVGRPLPTLEDVRQALRQDLGREPTIEEIVSAQQLFRNQQDRIIQDGAVGAGLLALFHYWDR